MSSSTPETDIPWHTNGEAPLPARVTWDQAAPNWTTDSNAWAEDGPGWDAWVRHLKRRSRPRVPKLLANSKCSPVLWALPSGLESGETAALAEELARFATRPRKSADAIEGLLRGWLQTSADRPRDAAFALECVAWCYALPAAAGTVSSRLWWHALDFLWQKARESVHLREEHDPLVDLLLAGELPYLLGQIFPEIEELNSLGEPGLATVQSSLQAFLAEDGHPLRVAVDLWRPLWACWTRVRTWSGDKPKWDEASEAQYQRLLVHTLRSARKDGSQSLQFGAASAWRGELFQAALSLAGGRAEVAAAAATLPGGAKLAKPRRGDLPPPAHEADEAKLAVLRRNWSAGSDLLAVDYRGAEVCTELQCGRDVLWSGPWTLDIKLDGQPAPLAGPWKNVCWFSDDDVDYLELEAPLACGAIIQRQMLLAREERFLLLADGLLGTESHRIDYSATLPLRPGITFAPADESREGYLSGRKRRAVVLPLALPEWRIEPRDGELHWTEEGLRLRQFATGPSLFAPLLFDLSPRRLDQPLTWRSLTVAETRQPVRAEHAVAYRVQVGQRQWVVYRSLNGKVNRTFLGVNVASEFFCGRFTRKGAVKPLLEIE